MNTPSLAVRLGPLKLTSPVVVASGTYGSGREGAAFMDLTSVGAIIVKSMTLTPWGGKATPRMCETPSGMLNAIGIQNKGVDVFMTDDLPWLRRQKASVIASIAGNTVEEFTQVARKLGEVAGKLAAIEVNISCPNLEDKANMFAHSAASTAAVIEGVRTELPRAPVFAKLSPNVTSLPEIAEAALGAGADGLSVINTVFGMAVDVRAKKPKLAGVVGGLSGPAIRPIAVRAVHEVHQAFPDAPIIGQGGVGTAEDALELVLAGASAVAVGTASFLDPCAAQKVAAGIAEHMSTHGIGRFDELVGSLDLG
jgi:dihydroorotate dehydrogenase (NAD+) catalytic subunit